MTSSWVLVFGAALFSTACGKDDGGTASILPLPCRPRPCGSVDEEASADDYVIHLDTATALLTWAADGSSADGELKAGVVVFHARDPQCLASSDQPCRVTLKRLRLELGSLTAPTTEGDVELEGVATSLMAPLELVDQGLGYVAKTGSELQSCMLVEGTADSASATLVSGLQLNLDFASEGLALTGSLPVRFHWGQWECSTLDLTATVVASGLAPWSKPEQ